MNPYPHLRPLLFCLNPEIAHNLTLQILSRAAVFIPRIKAGNPIHLLGHTFPNRLGLAAGLDKNAVAISAFDRLGFGFIEVGTATPRPQSGNPKPRLFRLPEHQAIINRMGFNNDGVVALCQQVAAVKKRTRALIGINIGKNKLTPNERAADDYLIAMSTAYPYADYLAINISSPNTVGLRDLQHGAALCELLQRLKTERDKLSAVYEKTVPLLVKIAPDNERDQLDEMLSIIEDSGIDGIIATNTTLDKTAVTGHRYADEQGGLSGKPLTEKSTKIIAHIRERLPNLPLIASGGVMSADDYYAKLEAGADLVQIYSGLIYHGPQLIKDCLRMPSPQR